MKGKHGVSAARARQTTAEQRADELETEVRRLKDQLRVQESRERAEVGRLKRDIKGWAIEIAREDIALVEQRANEAAIHHADEVAALNARLSEVADLIVRWIKAMYEEQGDENVALIPRALMERLPALTGVNAQRLMVGIDEGSIPATSRMADFPVHPTLASIRRQAKGRAT